MFSSGDERSEKLLPARYSARINVAGRAPDRDGTARRPPPETARLLISEADRETIRVRLLADRSAYAAAFDGVDADVRGAETRGGMSARVAAALARLDTPDYGYCQLCGVRIATGHLLKVPYAEHCFVCESTLPQLQRPSDRWRSRVRASGSESSRQNGSVTSSRSWVANRRDRAWTPGPPDRDALAFHRRLPGYSATPLVELPRIARELGVARVFAKDETQRLGLPAFKALGASWAVHRVVERIGSSSPITIVTATDGNHGRAVARFALSFGQRAQVLLPEGVHPEAVDAIRTEGAEVVQIEGTYDDAVARAAQLGSEDGRVLVQDTAWVGYEEIPGWIVDGYDTLFVEIDEQLGAQGIGRPDLVVVPTGVGSLLQAALVHYRQPGDGATRTAVVSVEPDTAACVHASLAAGRPVTVTTGRTSMAGLNCGTVSMLAWPVVVAGLDAALVTDDVSVGCAATMLAAESLDAGPCGAAALAALRGVSGSDATAFRSHVGIDSDATVVLLITEGTAANPHRS